MFKGSGGAVECGIQVCKIAYLLS